METLENECQFAQSYILRMKFSEFYLVCNQTSCEI